jgi:phospholipid/cholesterol/gamma-HCH transport system substrate-binding protein
MKPSYLEMVVGVFLALGILCLAYLSVRIARKDFVGGGGYEVQALFSNCGGLRPGSQVVIAGVEVGRVKRVTLEDYEAKVHMIINPGVVLQKDSIASIKTKGLIGEKYIGLTPGGADERIQPGGTIRDTEAAVDFEGLISKFVYGNVPKPSTEPAASLK